MWYTLKTAEMPQWRGSSKRILGKEAGVIHDFRKAWQMPTIVTLTLPPKLNGDRLTFNPFNPNQVLLTLSFNTLQVRLTNIVNCIKLWLTNKVLEQEKKFPDFRDTVSLKDSVTIFSRTRDFRNSIPGVLINRLKNVRVIVDYAVGIVVASAVSVPPRHWLRRRNVWLKIRNKW